tara:strand:+ start:1368 stop:2105 length:738 start_codon:yes stop_codon:yes gene_type:complete
MNRYVYLAWQEQDTRSWHIIGKLLKTREGYEFRYTKGINNLEKLPLLPNMPDHNEVYHSKELFSVFKNRLMSKSRPDYTKYISWMGLNESELIDDLATLAISGGEKDTDFFRVLPFLEQTGNSNYLFKFFVNGISHMSDNSKMSLERLRIGDELYLVRDLQNSFDKFALLLRTDNPPMLIGYIPAYLTKIIVNIVQKYGGDSIDVNVVKVNHKAPYQRRLLCQLSSKYLNIPWEEHEDEFRTIVP